MKTILSALVALLIIAGPVSVSAVLQPDLTITRYADVDEEWGDYYLVSAAQPAGTLTVFEWSDDMKHWHYLASYGPAFRDERVAVGFFSISPLGYVRALTSPAPE